MNPMASAPGESVRQRFAARWNDFFFAESPVYAAVYFRVFLAVWTAGFILPRLPHLRELYAERALQVPHPWAERFGGLLTLPLEITWLVTIALLVCLACFAAGYHARHLHPFIVLMLAYLLGYNLPRVHAYGQLAFYQWLVAYCLPYDRLCDRDGAVVRSPRWGLRIATMLFSTVYLFSVLAKTVSGEGWLDGKALFYTMRSPDYGSFLLSAWVPISLGVAKVLGWGTLANETFVGLGLWHGRTRRWAMLACFGMHLVMALSMRVSVLFHLLMVGHLPLFFADDTWQRIWPRGRRLSAFNGFRRSRP
ncbi:MAG TPA: HTTM domain-containing protein [Polyangiaceae bacterium]